MIVIHGPSRTGKTLHARRFAKHYGCTRIVDIPDFSTVRALRHEIRAGRLAQNHHSFAVAGEGTHRQLHRQPHPRHDFAVVGEGAQCLVLATEPTAYLSANFPPGTKLVSIEDARAAVGLEPIPEGGFPIEAAKPDTTDKAFDDDPVERIAAKLAKADGLNWAEVCGYEALPPLDDCDSGTCIAAHFEDHDPQSARAQYRKYARVAFEAGEIPDDVRRLVIAARCVLDMGCMDEENSELDKAAEAFASRVPYENQQETFDFDISDDGVMIALPTWQRNNEGTFLRLMLVDGHATTEADVAGWTDEQCQQADIWAWTSHLSASDNDDIKVPLRPDFLRPGDHTANRHPITGEPNA